MTVLPDVLAVPRNADVALGRGLERGDGAVVVRRGDRALQLEDARRDGRQAGLELVEAARELGGGGERDGHGGAVSCARGACCSKHYPDRRHATLRPGMTFVTPGGSYRCGRWARGARNGGLTQVAARLRALRDELAMIDEQLTQLSDEADDLALRALVAETPAASYESNDARKHADAMRRHRDHVVDEIAELEVRQDELLDRLTS